MALNLKRLLCVLSFLSLSVNATQSNGIRRLDKAKSPSSSSLPSSPSSSSSPSAPSPSKNSKNISASIIGPDKISTGWYAGWHSEDVPLEKVSWGKYGIVSYAFAITTPDEEMISLADSDKMLLPKFVESAHSHGVKASLSIGGWTGSQYFSSSLSTAQNRSAFVDKVVKMVEQYELDGVDFDWEYPNRQGVGCNTISSNDTSNFLSFLTQLRSTPTFSSPPSPSSNDSRRTISAATFLTPFSSPSGTPSTDVKGFSDILDWIVIMNYDVWLPLPPSPPPTSPSPSNSTGSPSSPTLSNLTLVGPNAPLDDSCLLQSLPNGIQVQGRGSAKSSVEAWVGAGFDVGKIVLGVPGYGHGWNVGTSPSISTSGSNSTSTTTNSTSPSSSPSSSSSNSTSLTLYTPSSYPPPRGDTWDSSPLTTQSTDQCGTIIPVGQGQSGVWNFRGMVSGGWLDGEGNVNTNREGGGGGEGGNGDVVGGWDGCSQTPFVYNKKTGNMISYDDRRSFNAKGSFITLNNLKGFAIWEVGSDFNDLLIDEMLQSIQLTQTNSSAIPSSIPKIDPSGSSGGSGGKDGQKGKGKGGAVSLRSGVLSIAITMMSVVMVSVSVAM